MVKDHYTNHQYHDLVNPEALEYSVRSENSIFFEVSVLFDESFRTVGVGCSFCHTMLLLLFLVQAWIFINLKIIKSLFSVFTLTLYIPYDGFRDFYHATQSQSRIFTSTLILYSPCLFSTSSFSYSCISFMATSIDF